MLEDLGDLEDLENFVTIDEFDGFDRDGGCVGLGGASPCGLTLCRRGDARKKQ